MNKPPRPRIHCHEELEADLEGHGLLSDAVLLKWFADHYSSSKHLLTLYSLAVGLKARSLVEIGFGRSTFVLARAAAENGGRLLCCDTKDFSYLLSPEERAVTTFLHGKSDRVWQDPGIKRDGIDFAFLDYFSDPALPGSFAESEIRACASFLKTNALLCVHDAMVPSYSISRLDWSRVAPGLEAAALPFNYGLWIARNKAASRHGTLADSWPKKT